MTKYDQSIIYKLCCKDTNITDIYVGSTTAFKNRKYQHKMGCNNEKGKSYNYKVYIFIRDNGGFENWDMIEIERFNAIDKRDLEKRERVYIESLKATLNKQIPTQTYKEWKEKNKDKLKEYRELNKDKIKEQQKEYRENYKDKIKEYREKNKDKIKEYYENNKDKIKEQQKEYRENNNDKIKEKIKEYNNGYYENNKEILKQKINCDCGGKYTHFNKSRHFKTKKHHDYINKKTLD